jgi:hypothetical protein
MALCLSKEVISQVSTASRGNAPHDSQETIEVKAYRLIKQVAGRVMMVEMRTTMLILIPPGLGV